jgi:cell division protein FtsZ
MSENGYSFDIPKHHKSIIKVIGVGGGGSNAVNHMFKQGIKDVEFVVCNTDVQALNSSPVPNKLQIGVSLTEGLGAGANPEKGKNAAIESKDEIRDLLIDDTKMVFITAGMGGGTGTGAAPIIARVAKDLDILTVGIITVPFAFEGKKKMSLANTGVEELKECCDTVLVILNDKLRDVHGSLSISNAFAQADNVLTTAAKGIAEIITVPGYVNVDFEDVRTVMKNAGAAVMGSAIANGENRARRAAEDALASPLLNTTEIHGAQKILLSIISGPDAELQMDELAEITDYIHEMAGDDAEVIFGHGEDTALGDNIRVTVIATGFDMEANEIRSQQPSEDLKTVIDLESDKQIGLFGGKTSIPPESESQEDLVPVTVNLDGVDDSGPGYEEEFERGYFFEFDEDKKEEELVDDKDIFGSIDEDLEKAEPAEMDHLDDTGMVSFSGYKSKRDKLIEQAKDRVEKLKGLKGFELSDDELKEKLDVPAYLRKKVNLTNVPHSSERDISKYNLNDDNQILGNNKFLHDNVD